jgi:hypothetical protein
MMKKFYFLCIILENRVERKVLSFALKFINVEKKTTLSNQEGNHIRILTLTFTRPAYALD